MHLHERLNCLGYFGFGSGWGMVRHRELTPEDGALYCSGCPLQDECWERHKERVARSVPDVVQAFEKMAKAVQGPALIHRWYQEHRTFDPYTAALSENLEDGAWAAKNGRPKDRGANTLPYPFKTRSVD